MDRADPLLKHIDYGFSMTVHGAQGATVQNVIAAMDSTSVLSTQKSFYVTISRAKESAEIFTDDAGQLRAVISKATGQRVSALDAISFRDALRSLNREHEEAVKLRQGGQEANNVYFVKFGDEREAPDLRATRGDQEPTLPGIERPKSDDPELRGSRTMDHEPNRTEERDAKAREEDEGKERLREPQEHRADREARENQEQLRGVPEERDRSNDNDRGFER